jgi:hypothetical protein
MAFDATAFDLQAEDSLGAEKDKVYFGEEFAGVAIEGHGMEHGEGVG